MAAHRRPRSGVFKDLLFGLLVLLLACGYGWMATADWPGP